MRSRLFAFFILILLLGLPVFGYWYFYRDRVSAIIFLAPPSSPVFSVHLRGTLGFSWLPLSDKIFEYESSCESSCIFSPIPPLSYGVTITSSGMTTIEDTITLTTKEEYKYDVRLEKSPVFDKIGKIIDTDMTLIDGIVENANMYFTGSFISIGQIPSGKIYAIRKSEEGSDIGILTLERFSPLFSLPFFVESASLDRSRQFLILRRDATESFLISLDGTLSVSFPFPDAVEIVQNISNTWKVLTRDGVMTLSSLGWEKNPRFRDYIDISPEYRLGYLSKDDKEKKSLQNIDSAESLFLLLDRKSTIVRTIEKGREIIGFISYEGSPAYIDPSGDIWKITY